MSIISDIQFQFIRDTKLSNPIIFDKENIIKTENIILDALSKKNEDEQYEIKKEQKYIIDLDQNIISLNDSSFDPLNLELYTQYKDEITNINFLLQCINIYHNADTAGYVVCENEQDKESQICRFKLEGVTKYNIYYNKVKNIWILEVNLDDAKKCNNTLDNIIKSILPSILNEINISLYKIINKENIEYFYDKLTEICTDATSKIIDEKIKEYIHNGIFNKEQLDDIYNFNKLIKNNIPTNIESFIIEQINKELDKSTK